MTDVRGKTENVCLLEHASRPARAVRLILLASVCMAIPQVAKADCSLTGGTNYLCSGVTVAPQAITNNNATVTTAAGFSLVSPITNQPAVAVSGLGAISYNDAFASPISATAGGVDGLVLSSTGDDGATPGSVTINTAGAISVTRFGINSSNDGTGSTFVSALGGVTSASYYGVFTVNGVSALNMTVNTTSVSAALGAVTVTNRGLGTSLFTASGAVTSAQASGVIVSNRFTATDLTINVTAVSGKIGGIQADNTGTGVTSVTASGAVDGGTGYGIVATNGALTYAGSGAPLMSVGVGLGQDLVLQSAGVSGGLGGIVAVNAGAGAGTHTTVVSTGTVAGGSTYGILALNGAATFDANGLVTTVAVSTGGDINVSATDASGAAEGIFARNTGSGGSTLVTATGLVTSTGANGILVVNGIATASLTVNAMRATGARYGIKAENGGNGATNVTATDMVTGTGDTAIYVYNQSTATDLTVTAATVSGGVDGIFTENDGTGATVVTATGLATTTGNGAGISAFNNNSATNLTVNATLVGGGAFGIYVESRGTGTVLVTATDSVTSDLVAGTGIYAFNHHGTDLIVNAARVSGGDYGIYAEGTGIGATTITATDLVKAASAQGSGIAAFNTLVTTTGLTVNAVDVMGGWYGIIAQNEGGGPTHVTATGDVNGTANYGILALNGGATFNLDGTIANVTAGTATDLIVNAANVTGGQDGLYVRNSGTGATSVTTTGLVTATANYGINAISDAMTTNLTVNAAAVKGALTGIYAENKGTGTTSVTATGDVTGTAEYGILASNAVGTGLTVNAARVTGGDFGIYTENNGTGAAIVTATGLVTATNAQGMGIGVYNIAPTSTGVTVNAAGAAGGWYGIVARNQGGGATSVAATGDVTGAGVYGILAVNGVLAFNPDGTVANVTPGTATDLIVNAANITGGQDGLYVQNGGAGATNVATIGLVTGMANFGIYGVNDITATDLTIRAVTVSGGRIGINADNQGTGATRIVATGDVIGGNDGLRALTNAPGSAVLTIDVKNVRGGLNGINASALGGNSIDITARGLVEGGTTGIMAQSTGSAVTIAITANAEVRNASRSSSGLAIVAMGGPATIVNSGRLTGVVQTGALNDTLVNNSVWTATGVSDFGGGANKLENASGGTIIAAVSATSDEVTRFNNLGTFTNRGLLTLQDGNDDDRLVISGNVLLASGSTFAIDADGSDVLQAGGSVAIDNATLDVKPVGGGFQLGRYTILTAAGGVSGQFAPFIAPVSAFLGARTVYDTNNVYLDITKVRAFADAGNTRNRIATGGGLDTLSMSSPLFSAVASLPTDTAARAVFDELSGEIHASIKGMLLDDSHIVRDRAEERLRTVLDKPDDGRPAVWVEGFGDWGHADSDGNAAAMSHNTGGVLGGVDVALFKTWRVGFMGGYSHTGFDVPDRASSGVGDNYHLAVYGGSQWGAWGLRSGAAYSWHGITTARLSNVIVPANRIDGVYNAATAQVFAELGYSVALNTVSLEPFANLAYVNLQTDGFTENGGSETLMSTGTRDGMTFATVGLHAAMDISMHGINPTLKGTLGWRHATDGVAPLSQLAFNGGGTFTIAAVPIARDAAIVEAGISVPVGRIANFEVSYTGQIGDAAITHGVKGNLVLRF